MTSFLQKVFNQISLQRDEKLWMSADDRLTSQRLQLLAEFPETQFAPQLKLDCVANSKNHKLSLALREKGNLCYAQGDTRQALSLYNQSLQFAPNPAEEDEDDPEGGSSARELAITYANRSAVWADRDEHLLAIRDADLAFGAGYPKELQYKLLERKAQCQLSLGLRPEAEASMREAVKALEASGLKGEKRRTKQLAFERFLAEELSRVPMRSFQEECDRFNASLMPTLTSPNSKFPSFSDAVEVRYERGRGRFCVARRKIRPGELLAVERPFVWMLDKEETRSHCWHCFRSAVAPLPCPGCAGLVFCGPECRSEAISSYHRYECGITEILYQAGIGGWALAYRAVISRPFEHFVRNKAEFEQGHNELFGLPPEEGPDVSGGSCRPYLSEDLSAFTNLVTHDNCGRKQAPELMMQALTAVFLLRCLRAKSYYPGDPTSPTSGSGSILSDSELFLARLLHHFMRVTYYNTHEITTATVTEENGEEEEDLPPAGAAAKVPRGRSSPDKLRLRRIGRATNPTLALLNHSCDPNYRRVSVGRNTLGFATKAIAEGEEVTDTYCPTFAAMGREQRRESLAKYNFGCACVCCREDWPTLGSLERKYHNLAGDRYQVPLEDVKKQMKRISTADHLIARLIREPDDQVDLDKLLELARRHLEEINRLVRPPHYGSTVAENKLYHVLLAIYASKSNVHFRI